MRDQFASYLLEIMREDSRVILLYGDIGNKLFDLIKDVFPERAINCGVAEANMVTVASGLASEGFRPYVYTISSFLYLKSLEQIKLDLCYPSLPVVLVGTGGGLSYSSLGTTHHSLEDFAVLGSLPNINLYHPADVFEMKLCMERAHKYAGPSWIRIGKKDQEAAHKGPLEISATSEILPICVFSSPESAAAILSSGVALLECIEAGKSLAIRGISVDVWSVPQLKPFPVEKISSLLEDYERLVVVEEHVPLGGLGTRIESLSPRKAGFYLATISSGDIFHFAAGEPGAARKSIGQEREKIVSAVVEAISP